ncbi:MAG: hypothetical protein HY245_07150 [Rhizobiales bacterium]|nr:hypothetical protein [Hyphomicrobiales bacterium]MBI3673180.1 hypothetical protein [Hyphomicrobiales bacterium]
MIPLWRAGAAALILIGLAGFALPKARAAGAEPALLGDFGDWAAYSYKAADTKVCYVSSRPKSSEPKTSKRDPAFFLVTNMPGRKVKGEVSTLIGYTFKQESSVDLTVDDTKFLMRTVGDGAWAEDSATDKKIVAAMRTGKSLTVAGTSARGTDTFDTYSLTGVSAALTKIDEACK